MTNNPQEHIFVAAGEPQVNFLLDRVFCAAGYKVSTAPDLTTAEHFLQEGQPALLVVGEKIAGGSGLDLAKKATKRLPNLPVILLLASGVSIGLQEASQCGIVATLTIPLHTEEVLDAVRTALQRSQRQREWALRESRRTSAELQFRMEELETIVRLGRVIASSLDLDSVLTAVVDAAVELTGAEEGSLLLLNESTGELYMRAGRNFQEEFVRTFRLPVKDTLAGNVIRTGQPVLLDERTPQKIKTAYLVQGLVYVPLESHGRVFGVLGVDNRQSQVPFSEHHIQLVSSISDYAVIAIENARLYAHTSLERNKLETIITQGQDGVIVLDAEERILIANKTVRAAYQLGEVNLSGRLFADVFSQPELIELVRSPEKRLTSRCEITLEDGRILSAQLTPISEVGLVITLHDITYLKKLDRIKSEFVSAVSHDLRTPLTTILGYVDLMERVGPLNNQQHDFMQRVQAGVHSITSLVDDLLDLGRIEAGYDTRRENVQLDQIVQYSIESNKAQVIEKNLQLLIEMPHTIPEIQGNPVHLRQMVDHAISNAVKYTPRGGDVEIHARTEDSQLILQVSDTGIGIPAVDLPYIFDKFYRASNVPGDAPGTGLGLAIVRSIVEEHRGRLWVNSQPEQGTTLTIVLPIDEINASHQ